MRDTEEEFLNLFYYVALDPTSMYKVSSKQFRMQREYDGSVFQTYWYQGKDWLAYGGPPSETERTYFGVSAAAKIWRGPETKIHEMNISLYNYKLNTEKGDIIGSQSEGSSSANEFYLNENYHRVVGKHIQDPQSSTPYITNLLGTGNNEGSCIYAYTSYTIDETPLMWVWRKYMWQFRYVKDDVNGKPLYMMLRNGGSGHAAGANESNKIQMNYQYIDDEGNIRPAYLWSIRKVE